MTAAPLETGKITLHVSTNILIKRKVSLTVWIRCLFIGWGRTCGHALVGGDCAGDVMIRGRGAGTGDGALKSGQLKQT